MKTSVVLYCLVGMVCLGSEVVKAGKEEDLAKYAEELEVS